MMLNKLINLLLFLIVLAIILLILAPAAPPAAAAVPDGSHYITFELVAPPCQMPVEFIRGWCGGCQPPLVAGYGR
jgi:type 1 fimbria pilin